VVPPLRRRARLGIAWLLGAVFVVASPSTAFSDQGESGRLVAAAAAVSDAERIARLERSIELDEKRLRALQAELTAPDSEYHQAEAAFRELDAERAQRQKRLQDAEESGTTEHWARLQADNAAFEKKWLLAKERFDLEIAERKAIQESIATLERKLENDREALDQLHGVAIAPKPVETPPPAPPVAEAPKPAEPAPAETKPALPPIPGLPGLDLSKFAKLNLSPAVSQRLAEELAAAHANAQQSSDAASAAEAAVRALNERIEILQKDIEQQRKLRETARKKVDNADQTLKNLNEELFQKLMQGEDISDLKQQIRETTARMLEYREASRKVATHLDDLQSTLAVLQSEQMDAAKEASRKREAANLALDAVQKLEDPWTLQNVLKWLKIHCPRIIVVLTSICVLLWLSRVFETRLVSLIARRGRRGSREERENRAKTLLGVFNNVMNLLIMGGGALMLLEEVGIPITPVIGGAAVVGLAVAFGAQSLIKDYFTGFMVLFEQQYLINDVIKIGDITGQVERITLRMTVLRDIEGRVHFVPHGQITTVTNLTHGWSRAVFEIGITHRERVDDVIAVLKRLASGIRQDEQYRFLILDEPVMLGVDSLSESAVVIKFYIQTRPLQQWGVKREMLRRIKNEFDRLNIQISYPRLALLPAAQHAVDVSEADAEHWNRRDVA
jgi:small-conductance mechanosensitive channel